jgi:hypothetical protein
MGGTVVDAGIECGGNIAPRECWESFYVADHRRVSSALRGDEAEWTLQWMAGWVPLSCADASRPLVAKAPQMSNAGWPSGDAVGMPSPTLAIVYVSAFLSRP